MDGSGSVLGLGLASARLNYMAFQHGKRSCPDKRKELGPWGGPVPNILLAISTSIKSNTGNCHSPNRDPGPVDLGPRDVANASVSYLHLSC